MRVSNFNHCFPVTLLTFQQVLKTIKKKLVESIQLMNKSGICESCFIMTVKRGCLGTWSINAGATGTTQVHPKGMHATPQAKA